MASGRALQEIDIKESGINGVSFSRDGSLIAYCAGAQVPRVSSWERVTSIRINAGERLENGPHGKASQFGLAKLFVREDSRLIVGGGICVPVSKEESAPYDFACTTTGLLWGAAFNDPASAKLLEEPRIGHRFRLSLSPGGQRFATSVERENNKGNPDPKIELREVSNGKRIWKVDADRGTLYRRRGRNRVSRSRPCVVELHRSDSARLGLPIPSPTAPSRSVPRYLICCTLQPGSLFFSGLLSE